MLQKWRMTEEGLDKQWLWRTCKCRKVEIVTSTVE